MGPNCINCGARHPTRREIETTKPLFRKNGYRRKGLGDEANYVGKMPSVNNLSLSRHSCKISSSLGQNEQLDEIRDIIEMKVSHRKNIKRRQDRFGFESNSLIGLDLANANVIAPGAEDENDIFAET